MGQLTNSATQNPGTETLVILKEAQQVDSGELAELFGILDKQTFGQMKAKFSSSLNVSDIELAIERMKRDLIRRRGRDKDGNRIRHPNGYLSRSVADKCRTLIREKQKRAPFGEHQPMCRDATPEFNALLSGVAIRLRQMLLELDSRKRKVIIFRVLYKQSAASTAKRLRTTESHVNTLKSRAIRKLRRIANNYGVDEEWIDELNRAA